MDQASAVPTAADDTAGLADRAQRGHLHRVVDPLHALLADRALVEVGGDVVRRRADQLHAALAGLVVGPGALERGQEGVVDVDHASLHRAAQVVREHLHVAGEHHQLDRRQFVKDIDRYASMRRDAVPYVQVTKEKLERPRRMVGEVYAALVALGYDGPRPEFRERWKQLFMRLSDVVAAERRWLSVGSGA